MNNTALGQFLNMNIKQFDHSTKTHRNESSVYLVYNTISIVFIYLQFSRCVVPIIATFFKFCIHNKSFDFMHKLAHIFIIPTQFLPTSFLLFSHLLCTKP